MAKLLVFLLDLRDLFDTAFVATCVELGVEPGFHDILDLVVGSESCRKSEDVRVVVFAREASDLLVPSDG